jgi:hypothetical protein
MAPKTIAANVTAAVFSDVFMVSISDAATRITEFTGPAVLMIANLTALIDEGQSR